MTTMHRPGVRALLEDWQAMSRLRRYLFVGEADVKAGRDPSEADRAARAEIRSIRAHLAAIDADLAGLHPTAEYPAGGGRADELLADLAAAVDRPDLDGDR